MIKVENNRGAEGNESINKIGIGLSIAAVASVSVAVIASEKLLRRYLMFPIVIKLKFVDDKFDGNQKLLSIVDDLSDDELDSVLNVVDRVKDGGSKLAEYGEKLKTIQIL